MNRIGEILFGLYVFSLVIFPVSAAPKTLWSPQSINYVKQALSQNKEPWQSAWKKALNDANNALLQSPLSVVSDGGGKTQDKFHFATDAPYLTDGIFDPNAHRDDYSNALTISRAVVNLGIAYQITGDEKYAAKARSLLKVWCIDSTTAMYPSADNYGPATNGHAGNGPIELFITLPGIIYGADLVWDSPSWTAAEKASLTAWIRQVTASARSLGPYKNNFENWRLLLIATGGAFIEDTSAISYVYTTYQTLLPVQMSPTGQMTYEVGRTDSLSYSLYAINAMITTAHALSHKGYDLYGMTKDGRSLRLALTYYAQYAINPGSWPYQQKDPLDKTNNVSLYELAYAAYGDTLYKQVIDKWGRPMVEIRVLQQPTLTHSLLVTQQPTTNPSPTVTNKPGDFTGDGKVDISDLQFVLAAFSSIISYNRIATNYGK